MRRSPISYPRPIALDNDGSVIWLTGGNDPEAPDSIYNGGEPPTADEAAEIAAIAEAIAVLCDCGKGPWCPQYGPAANARMYPKPAR